MKMKMIIFAAVAMVMAACGGDKMQGGSAVAESIPVDSVVKVKQVREVKEPKATKRAPKLWSETAVVAQVRDYFSEVNKMAATDGIDVERLDKMFCSNDFLELKSMLGKKVQKGEVMFEGDEGYHWTAGLAAPITVDSVSTVLTVKDQARAEVWLKDEHENRGYLELALYLEDGMWKVHDWIDGDVYPFGALFNWMQSVYDGETDDEEVEEEEKENKKE